MDRREMLSFSFRRISKALPTVLGITTGLGGLLKLSETDPPGNEAACFPKSKKDHDKANVHSTDE
ncbi:MAG: hypothetical protein ACYC27_12255 [Armatimonadota bacterium]